MLPTIVILTEADRKSLRRAVDSVAAQGAPLVLASRNPGKIPSTIGDLACEIRALPDVEDFSLWRNIASRGLSSPLLHLDDDEWLESPLTAVDWTGLRSDRSYWPTIRDYAARAEIQEVGRCYSTSGGVQFYGVVHEFLGIAGSPIPTCSVPLVVGHDGYSADADGLAARNARNLRIMHAELSKGVQPTERMLFFWVRDGGLLENFDGYDVRWVEEKIYSLSKTAVADEGRRRLEGAALLVCLHLIGDRDWLGLSSFGQRVDLLFTGDRWSADFTYISCIFDFLTKKTITPGVRARLNSALAMPPPAGSFFSKDGRHLKACAAYVALRDGSRRAANALLESTPPWSDLYFDEGVWRSELALDGYIE